jgi:hypothetical protein
MAWFLAGPAAALLALSLSKSSAAEQTATPFSTAAGLLETLELQLENPRIRLAALATLLLAILKVQQPVLAQSEAAADAASPATAPTTASADSSWESGHAVSLRGGFGRAPTLCSGTSRYNGGMAAYDYVRRNQNGTEVAFGAQVDGAAHREHSESSEDQPADNGVDQTIARLSPRFRVSTPVVSLEVAVPLVTASTSGVAVIQDSEELAYTRAHLRVGREERVFAELGVNHITPEQFEVPLLTALQVGGGLDVSRFINAPTGTVLRAGVYGFPEGLDVGPYVAVKVPLKRAGWSLEPSAFFVTSEWWNASIGLTFEPVWTERATR